MPLIVPLERDKTDAYPALVCSGDDGANTGATEGFLVHAEPRLGGFGAHPTNSLILKFRIFIWVQCGRFECIPIAPRNDPKRLVTSMGNLKILRIRLLGPTFSTV